MRYTLAMVSAMQTADAGEAGALDAGLTAAERQALARALDFAQGAYADRLLGTGDPPTPTRWGWRETSPR